MAVLHRVAIGFLIASTLSLASCPYGMDHRDGRDDRQNSEQRNHCDDRGDRGDARRDGGHDSDRHPDNDSPR